MIFKCQNYIIARLKKQVKARLNVYRKKKNKSNMADFVFFLFRIRDCQRRISILQLRLQLSIVWN